MSETLDVDDLISISEASRVRGVTHGAIQDLIKREKLTSYKIGGRRLLSRREVEKFKPGQVGKPAKNMDSPKNI